MNFNSAQLQKPAAKAVVRHWETRLEVTDGKAMIAALEKTDMVLGRGRYRFSTSHTPDWAWHQFMEAPVALIQYDKEGQEVDDAPIIWPRSIATTKSLFLKP